MLMKSMLTSVLHGDFNINFLEKLKLTLYVNDGCYEKPMLFLLYINTLFSHPNTPTLSLNLSLPRHCNSFVFLAIVSLSRHCNPFSSSTHDIVNSSFFFLFFELKLSRSWFLLLLLLLQFLKVSPKSKLILAHTNFSLLVLFWINLSCLLCVVWLGANMVKNLYLHSTFRSSNFCFFVNLYCLIQIISRHTSPCGLLSYFLATMSQCLSNKVHHHCTAITEWLLRFLVYSLKWI